MEAGEGSPRPRKAQRVEEPPQAAAEAAAARAADPSPSGQPSAPQAEQQAHADAHLQAQQRRRQEEACGVDGGAPSGSGRAGGGEDDAKVERLLRRVETVLAHRCDSILLVLERPFITDNYLGCLRTAECMGIQNVWIVVQQRGYHKTEPPPSASSTEIKDFRRRVRLSRQSAQWLDVQEFGTTTECVAELKAGGWEIWATDLSAAAVNLASPGLLSLPRKLAVVMGREADGCTPEMLAAANRRVYLPVVGFNQSLNLQVATGMVLQQLLNLRGDARGDMPDARRASLRREWYTKLARSEAHLNAMLRHVDSPPAAFEDARDLYAGGQPGVGDAPEQ